MPYPTPPADPVPRLQDAIAYRAGQRAWLGDYAVWQAAGCPVGSGLIERAVELVIHGRMKRQGMRWFAPTLRPWSCRARALNADWDEADRLDPPAA